jgi:MFS transporter, DHA3 family, macrolide efflux protein
MTTSSPFARPSAFAVFRKRNFTILWIGQFIETMGTALTSLAASILVYRITGSALSVGLMLMATALPSLFVGLIAGVFVDRYDRKRIMIAAQLIRAVLIASIPFLVQSGIIWLYVLVMLSSAVGQFYDPAHESVLPEVASDEELAAANSLMTISTVGSTTVGFAAAGLIASRLSIEWAFYLDAVSFLISAACIAALQLAPIKREDTTTARVLIDNLQAGLRWVRDTTPVRSLFLLFIPVFVLFGLHNSLVLPFSIQALNATEFEYSLIEGVFSVGFVLGSLLMARLADRLHEGQWITISLVGLAIANAVFALATVVPIAIVVFVLGGAFNAPSYIGRQLLIQRNTVREIRGRVISAFLVTRDVAFIGGMAAAGLADYFNVRWLLVVSAVLLLAIGLVSLIMPGIQQSKAEWRRIATMLRTARAAGGIGLGRAATPADLDQLAVRLPLFSRIDSGLRRTLAEQARVHEAPAGTAIVSYGEASDAAYFVLDGRVVAGREEQGTQRVLEVLNAGDFFGEIAALTGVARTADVVAERDTRVLQVSAPALRQLMQNADLNRLFLSKMTERMMRMSMVDMPRVAGLDQGSLRELRTPQPVEAPMQPESVPPAGFDSPESGRDLADDSRVSPV